MPLGKRPETIVCHYCGRSFRLDHFDHPCTQSSTSTTDRIEKVTLRPVDSLMRRGTTLGDLRRLVRQIAHWPDDSDVNPDTGYITVTRSLPVSDV